MFRPAFLPALLIACLLPTAAPKAAACGENDLRVMSFNLEFSRVWTDSRQIERLAAGVAGKDIDVLLLQEVSGGLLTGTSSTAGDLRRILHRRHGLSYELVHAPASGVRGLFTVGNAILSRCPITSWKSYPLPQVAELGILGGRWRLARNLLAADIETARGSVALYATHLCAACSAGERMRQLEVVLATIDRREADRRRPVVLGGDFNLDLFRDQGIERPLYRRIRSAGFVDAATSRLPAEHLCARPAHPDAFCTVGVADPYRPQSRRIDYLFVRSGLIARDLKVLFHPHMRRAAMALSDHAAILARLGWSDRPERHAGAMPLVRGIPERP